MEEDHDSHDYILRERLKAEPAKWIEENPPDSDSDSCYDQVSYVVVAKEMISDILATLHNSLSDPQQVFESFIIIIWSTLF